MCSLRNLRNVLKAEAEDDSVCSAGALFCSDNTTQRGGGRDIGRPPKSQGEEKENRVRRRKRCACLCVGSGINDVLIHCATFARCSLEISVTASEHVRTSGVRRREHWDMKVWCGGSNSRQQQTAEPSQ